MSGLEKLVDIMKDVGIESDYYLRTRQVMDELLKSIDKRDKKYNKLLTAWLLCTSAIRHEFKAVTKIKTNDFYSSSFQKTETAIARLMKVSGKPGYRGACFQWCLNGPPILQIYAEEWIDLVKDWVQWLASYTSTEDRMCQEKNKISGLLRTSQNLEGILEKMTTSVGVKDTVDKIYKNLVSLNESLEKYTPECIATGK